MSNNNTLPGNDQQNSHLEDCHLEDNYPEETVLNDGASVNNQYCHNCDQQLIGKFCHTCGQENTNINITFFQLVNDFLGDMFTYDSRFYRTMVPLMFRPGFLTKEFFLGRRIRYVPPLRLYLFISFILFLWLALVASDSINIGTPDTGSDVTGEIATAIREENPELSEDWIQRIEKSAKAVTENPNGFVSLITSRLPYLMFILLPVFALLLWLHFPFSGYNYLQHFVFTLHFHSFAYLINLFFSLADKIVTWDYGLWAVLICNIYIAFALRKTYDSGIAGCIFKTISILTLYLIVLGSSFAVFIIVNVLGYG